jgi:hypothetical protein
MKRYAWYLAVMVLMAGLPAFAQTPDSGGRAPSDQSTPSDKARQAAKTATGSAAPKGPDDGKAQKKVWTNDNMGTLKGSVSVVGGRKQEQAEAEYAENEDGSDGNPRQARIQQYRDAIGNLRRAIDDADARIAKLKDFKGENTSPSGGINPNQKYNMVPPEEQVKQLEARKRQMQGKIEDLENQARKEGIDPGELR